MCCNWERQVDLKTWQLFKSMGKKNRKWAGQIPQHSPSSTVLFSVVPCLPVLAFTLIWTASIIFYFFLLCWIRLLFPSWPAKYINSSVLSFFFFVRSALTIPVKPARNLKLPVLSACSKGGVMVMRRRDPSNEGLCGEGGGWERSVCFVVHWNLK